MGQQTMGHYPVHFHMNGDVDERGGYSPPTSISQLSIHHSFSRCVTIHGSNGLLVKFTSSSGSIKASLLKYKMSRPQTTPMLHSSSELFLLVIPDTT